MGGNTMSDVVIRVKNVSKEYRLGTISHGTLYRDLQSGWAKFRGREDPNTRLGSGAPAPVNDPSGRFLALNDVSFDVDQGETLGIIGRNGAGKSTLLKILSRVTAPTTGSIRIRGRVASLLEVGTGFHPELSGRENIFLNGAILGMRKGEIEQKYDEIVKFSEIDRFIDTPVKRYSSGMYVRLAFAVAAHLEPEILIVDEVLAVGDAGFQKKCLGKMEDVAKGGRTVLFVSHNMGAIQSLCSRVILLEAGCISADGPAKQVVAHYMNTCLTKTELFSPKNNRDYADIVIEKAIFKNQHGQKSTTFGPFDDLYIEIYYHALKRISKPYFWVTVNSMSGILFGANMLFDDGRPEYIEDHGIITCIFPKISLLPNVYSVMFSIRDEKGTHHLMPAIELGNFYVEGTAEDLHMKGELADNFFNYFHSLIVPYAWRLPNGDLVSFNGYSDAISKPRIEPDEERINPSEEK
jgi:lipopolysaccharide transport system ATP-binding protein